MYLCSVKLSSLFIFHYLLGYCSRYAHHIRQKNEDHKALQKENNNGKKSKSSLEQSKKLFVQQASVLDEKSSNSAISFSLEKLDGQLPPKLSKFISSQIENENLKNKKQMRWDKRYHGY